MMRDTLTCARCHESNAARSPVQRIPEKLNNPVNQKVKRACRCQSPTQEFMRDPWSSVMMKEGYEERVREYVMCWFTLNSISLLVEPVSFSFVLRSILWSRQSDDRPYKQFSYIWLQKQYEKEKEILRILLYSGYLLGTKYRNLLIFINFLQS